MFIDEPDAEDGTRGGSLAAHSWGGKEPATPLQADPLGRSVVRHGIEAGGAGRPRAAAFLSATADREEAHDPESAPAGVLDEAVLAGRLRALGWEPAQ